MTDEPNMIEPKVKKTEEQEIRVQELNQQENKTISSELPEILPILPLRGLVVYPFTAVPLTVGQPRSIRLVDEAMAGDRMIGLVASRNQDVEAPEPEDLYTIGTVAVIHRLFRASDGTIRLVVQGLSRFKIKEFKNKEPYLTANVESHPEIIGASLEEEAVARNIRDQFQHIAEMLPSIPEELVASIVSIQDPLQTTYTIANLQRMDLEDGQKLLELDQLIDKLKMLVGILTHETEVLELGKKIQNEAREEIDKVQREYFLREQLKAIRKELGEGDEQTADIVEFKEKISLAGKPEEAEKLANRELERLSRLPTAAAEYGVIRTFLEWLVNLPWSVSTQDNLDITHARKILERDHYDLEDVKERIIEFLAVRKLHKERSAVAAEAKADEIDDIRHHHQGVILCFVGPPGVGKTSLGKSIASALGRKFVRISLGGVRDEAEIRGHRRTYIGAMPGRIIQSLRRVESNNPVFMMDEIDKLSTDFRGDPASALLEVLDPEQNNEFRDNYLEAPFDLSQVMFITTANQIGTIPIPLLDRMEVINLSGYTESEKVKIAQQYLIPRQLRENSLFEEEVVFKEEAIVLLIRLYTKEAGIRNLEREIGNICRKVATRITEGSTDPIEINPTIVRNFLGKPKYFETEEMTRRSAYTGVAIGLAWTPFGGDVLYVEATRMPGNKALKITGSIGKVMQESAEISLSLLISNLQKLGIEPDVFSNNEIHLHVPAGAQPKDGPSAGITMYIALASLFTDRLVKPDLAMTGEITLKGQVLPVGGVKEKVLAAHRVGIKTILLPKLNEIDLEEIPDEIKQSIQLIFIETVDEAYQQAIGKPNSKKKK